VSRVGLVVVNWTELDERSKGHEGFWTRLNFGAKRETI